MRKLLGCGYNHPYHCYYIGPNSFGKDIVGDETKASGDGQAFFFPENIGERCAFGASPTTVLNNVGNPPLSGNVYRP
jgi:hypothetical protein